MSGRSTTPTQRLLDSARTICTLLRDEQWDMRASTFAKAYADLQASITSFVRSEIGETPADRHVKQDFAEPVTAAKFMSSAVPTPHSDDLAGRLRFAFRNSHGAPSILTEAADEIERLRSVLRDCRLVAEWHAGDGDECGVLARSVMERADALGTMSAARFALTADGIEAMRHELKCATSNLWTASAVREEGHAKIDALCDAARKGIQ